MGRPLRARRRAQGPSPTPPVNYIVWPRDTDTGLGHRQGRLRVAPSKRPGGAPAGAFPIPFQRQVLLAAQGRRADGSSLWSFGVRPRASSFHGPRAREDQCPRPLSGALLAGAQDGEAPGARARSPEHPPRLRPGPPDGALDGGDTPGPRRPPPAYAAAPGRRTAGPPCAARSRSFGPRRRGSRYAAHIVRSPSSRRGPTAWSCVPSADDSRARAVGASPTRPRLRHRPCRP